MTQTRTSVLRRAHALAEVVADAQRLANAEDRTYCVSRGVERSTHPADGPWCAPLESALPIGALLLEGINAGLFLPVPPQGVHAGLSGVDIVTAEIAAKERRYVEERLRLDAEFREQHREYL